MPEPTRTSPPADATAALASSNDTPTAPAGGPPGPRPAGPPGYELLDAIGRGGMGDVYRARDVALNREVAVKLLQDRYPPDSATARRFLDEATITGQLQHPGIPAVHQVGTLPDGRPFLAMKLIKGRTLADALADPSADRGRFVGLFEQVCQAVAYAHARGVIHRDLKPANVMVGAFGEVQVMDWGLAKLMRNAECGMRNSEPDLIPHSEIRIPHSQETQAGSVLGTPAFMPPEQAGGEVEKVDERADVFGLGALLCVALTGHPPFVGKDADAVRLLAIRGQVGEAFARLDACGADPDLVALAKRCLSPDRDDRPRDAVAVAKAVADLRAAADERAKRAELDLAKAAVRAAEQRKRRRWVGGLAAVVVAVAAGGAAGMYALWQQAERNFADAEQARFAEGRRADAEARASAEAEENLMLVSGLTYDVMLRRVFELIPRPPLTPENERRATAAVAVCRRLAERDPADLEAKRVLAEAVHEFAWVYHVAGRYDAALTYARDAARIQTGVAGAAGGLARDHLRAHDFEANIGLMLCDTGRHTDGVEQVAAARDRTRRVPRPADGDDLAVWLEENCNQAVRHGIALTLAGRPGEAAAAAADGLALAEEVCALRRGRGYTLRNVAGVYAQLAVSPVTAGAGARRRYEDAGVRALTAAVRSDWPQARSANLWPRYYDTEDIAPLLGHPAVRAVLPPRPEAAPPPRPAR